MKRIGRKRHEPKISFAWMGALAACDPGSGAGSAERQVDLVSAT